MSKEIMQGLGITLILGFVLLFCLSFWGGPFRSVFYLLGGRPRSSHSPAKACYGNQRVLLGAVEMYNMDHSVMTSVLDHHVALRLQSEKYLKSPVVCPESGSYSGKDLLGSGTITCSRHGPVVP